uniref:HDAg domain-containing protein n=1 Tax=Sus scrofa TaxID=9823 RepID=A0A8D1JUH5_PIG
MASMRESDTGLWLHNKLGATDELWAPPSIASLLTAAVIDNIRLCFHGLSSAVKLKLLLGTLHLPRRTVDEMKGALTEIIQLATLDSDPWVLMVADILKSFPDTGSLNLDLEEQNPNVQDILGELREKVNECEASAMLPLECQYLNKNALTTLAGPLTPPVKHFQLKRKPKSATLRAELLQKSTETAQQLKRSAGVPFHAKGRGLLRKMDTTTPLKGIPKQAPFRSPTAPSVFSPAGNRTPIPPSRTPLRKERGVKLLDISELDMVGAGREAKRRRKTLDAEVVEKPAKEETVVENATPDYAAGLVSTQVGLRAPWSLLSRWSRSCWRTDVRPRWRRGPGRTVLPGGSSPSSEVAGQASREGWPGPRCSEGLGLPAGAGPACPRAAGLPGTMSHLVAVIRFWVSGNLPLISRNASAFVARKTSLSFSRRRLVWEAPQTAGAAPEAAPGSSCGHSTRAEPRPLGGAAASVFQKLGSLSSEPALPSTSYLPATPSAVPASSYIPSSETPPAPSSREASLQASRPPEEPSAPSPALPAQFKQRAPMYNSGPSPAAPAPPAPSSPLTPTTPPAVAPAAQTPPVAMVAPQAQPPAQQQPKKNLSLTREQMFAAQEMFKTANKVTRPEKALILGFMAGSRENPCQEQGDVIQIKLSEHTEDLPKSDGQGSTTMLVDTVFEMNYATGQWTRFKKYKPMANAS